MPVQWDMYRLKKDPRFKEKFPDLATEEEQEQEEDRPAPSVTVRLNRGQQQQE